MTDKKTVAKSPASKEFEVTLKTDHTHAGKQYEAGEKIKVTETQKDWLVANGVVGGSANKENK